MSRLEPERGFTAQPGGAMDAAMNLVGISIMADVVTKGGER